MKCIQEIINNYTLFNEVKAIAIGGSSSAKTSDNISDIDVYIFVEKDIPIEKRAKLIQKYSTKAEIGGEYFGSGDEFLVDCINQQLDVMYWNTTWFENSIKNVWEKHYPSNGYTTCFLYTLKNFEIIYDPNNWLKNLQDKLTKPYPQRLKENIIKRNFMLIKDKPFASYYEQIQKAIKRNDIISINHRISAFIASYFDIIFALNETLHPGEKRLINFAKKNCNSLPKNFEENLLKLLSRPNNKTIEILDEIILELKNII